MSDTDTSTPVVSGAALEADMDNRIANQQMSLGAAPVEAVPLAIDNSTDALEATFVFGNNLVAPAGTLLTVVVTKFGSPAQAYHSSSTDDVMDVLNTQFLTNFDGNFRWVPYPVYPSSKALGGWKVTEGYQQTEIQLIAYTIEARGLIFNLHNNYINPLSRIGLV